MSDGMALQPWDDEQMTKDLIRLVVQRPRERLDQLAPPAMPGAYLQFIASDPATEALGPLVATGRYPAYAGLAAKSLRERIGRYKQTTKGLAELSERNIFISYVPCASKASACFAEASLIDQLHPLLNGLGWGSKIPGAKRTGQRCSPVDALFPGRRWAPEASLRDQASARLRVLAHLVRLDPGGPRWPALCDEVATEQPGVG